MVAGQPSYTILPIINKHIKPISNCQFTGEPDMYDPVVECLSPIFAKCKEVDKLGPATVSDTHGTKFLENFAPDISICRGSASPLTLCAFIETSSLHLLATRTTDRSWIISTK